MSRSASTSPSSIAVTPSREAAPLRVLRPRRASPSDAVRPTRAEVDLAALRHNAHVVRKLAGPARVWGVLKADGYGHGAPAVARTLERAGLDGFCVALLEEAIELREAGITAPILVMGGYYGESYDELLHHDLVPVVYEPGQVERLSRALRLASQSGGTKTRARVHLKIDTGMSRLGVTPSQLPAMLEAIAALPSIELDGLMTHFATADVAGDEGRADVEAQLARFSEATAIVRRAGFAPRHLHASNSAGLLRASTLSADARLSAVRPGIALFGVDPLATGVELRASLRLRTEVVALRTIEVGAGVGYGSTFRASRPTTIATVPVGYADGLPRALSNRGHMLVRGVRAPIVGAVSMDLATLDVTDVPGVRVRDEVVALGDQGKERISVEEIATTAGMIPWDVLTSISRRVPRFYRQG